MPKREVQSRREGLPVVLLFQAWASLPSSWRLTRGKAMAPKAINSKTRLYAFVRGSKQEAAARDFAGQ